jgi:hypothetical protein
VNFFQVVDSEINVIREWLRLFAVNGWIDKRQDYRAAVDVVARGIRDSSAAVSEQLAVKLFSLIEIVNL